MLDVVFTLATRSEVTEAFDWYHAISSGLSGNFYDEIDKAVEQVRKNPKAFENTFRDVRRILLKRFPYALFYRVMPDAIVVIACFHSSRNPKKRQRR